MSNDYDTKLYEKIFLTMDTQDIADTIKRTWSSIPDYVQADIVNNYLDNVVQND